MAGNEIKQLTPLSNLDLDKMLSQIDNLLSRVPMARAEHDVIRSSMMTISRLAQEGLTSLKDKETQKIAQLPSK